MSGFGFLFFTQKKPAVSQQSNKRRQLTFQRQMIAWCQWPQEAKLLSWCSTRIITTAMLEVHACQAPN